MYEVISAIKYLQDLDPPIVHRDIKPENVLIKYENGKEVLKLCDFGTINFIIKD